MSIASRSGGWFVTAVAVAATAFLAATSASSARAGGADPCTALTPIVKSVFGISTPVSESTGTVNGATGTICTWGAGLTAWIEQNATLKGYESSIPKSGTPVHGMCSKSVAESGTNTTVTTNAKTGKSKMTTTETENLWCYRAKPPEELKLTIMPITSGDQASELGKAEKAANAWMQNLTTTAAACEAKLVITKELIGDSENYHRSLGEYTTFPRAQFHWAVRVTNESNCVAKNVEIDDTLPFQFDCTGGLAGIPTRLKSAPPIACEGKGHHLAAHVGDLAPHAVAVLAADGSFVGPGKSSSYTTSNVAFARADNASEEGSNTIHVEVVLHSKFVKP